MKTWWTQHGPRTLWLALLGLAAILLVRAGLTWTDPVQQQEAIADLKLRLQPQAEDAAPPEASASSRPPTMSARTKQASTIDPQVVVKRIADRHLFEPAPPDGFRNVQGILGNRVLYGGGSSFGVGDQAMGARIVAIGTNWVEFQFNDETVVVDIFRNGTRGPERLRAEGSAGEPGNLAPTKVDPPAPTKRRARPDRNRNRSRSQAPWGYPSD